MNPALRSLLVIVGFVMSLVVPGIASPHAAIDVEICVGAFDLADGVRGVRDRYSLTLELHQGCEPTYDQLASDSLLAPRGGPYSHLDDHPSVGPGKDFTQSQKQKILKENEGRGGGLDR